MSTFDCPHCGQPINVRKDPGTAPGNGQSFEPRVAAELLKIGIRNKELAELYGVTPQRISRATKPYR